MLGVFYCLKFKGVAQLEERRSPKPYVVGSNPIALAKKINHERRQSLVVFLYVLPNILTIMEIENART